MRIGLLVATVARTPRVESGARLHLTTPSASRIHAMRAGRAELEQKFFVARGGWLELQPSLLIPQKDCRYRQTTRVQVEDGGELFLVESLSPGRVAHGEWFQFSGIDWEFDLYWAGRLIARERFVLRPRDESLAALKSPFPHGYYASGYLITERLTAANDCWRQINELNSGDVLVAASRLAAAGWSIKLLARDSPALDSTLKAIRRILSVSLPALQSNARKL